MRSIGELCRDVMDRLEEEMATRGSFEPREFAVKDSGRRSVGGSGFLLGVEVPQMFVDATSADAGAPAALGNVNALDIGREAPGGLAPVVLVLTEVTQPQVGGPVVVANPVDVINGRLGPLPEVHGPRQTMGAVEPSSELDLDVSLFVNGPSLEPVVAAYQPSEFATDRIVSEGVAEFSDVAGVHRSRLPNKGNGTERSAVKRARPSGPSQRCPAANEGGDQPGSGEAVQPVAFAREGTAQTGMKSGGATDFSPTKLPPLWKTPQGGVRLGGFVKADISMVTVNAATKGMPQPSAVIIDMLAWKAAHLSPPTTARTSSAAKTRAKPATK